jgi:hypothetical protein
MGRSVSWRYTRRSENALVETFDVALSRVKCSFTLAFIDPYFGAGVTATPLQRLLADLPKSAVDADVVVLRGISRSVLATESIDVVDLAANIADRVGRGSVSLAALDFADEPLSPLVIDWLTKKPSFVGGPQNVQLTDDEFLAAVRELEMLAHLQRTGAVYRLTDGHFQLPSHAHSDTYIRVADAFDDIWVVRRIVDWLQHHLSKNTVLLSDTWTTLPVMQELAARAERAFSGVRLPILTFAEYPNTESGRNRLETLSALFSGAGEARIFALVSVVSSGNLLSIWRNEFQLNFPGYDVRTVALIGSGEERAEVDTLGVVTPIRRLNR